MQGTQDHAKMIQKRMELPIGVKPAARVVNKKRVGKRIEPPRDLPMEDEAGEDDENEYDDAAAATVRSSRRSKRDCQPTKTTTNDTKSNTNNEEEEEGEDGMSSVMGSVVVERPRRSKKKGSSSATTKQRRDVASSSNNKFTTTIRSNGFPSLRAAPVGTLVRPRPGGGGAARNNNNNDQQQQLQPPQPTKPKEEIIRELEDRDGMPAKRTNVNNKKKDDDDVQGLLQDSAREASALLQNMTTAEVRQHVQQLTTSLDPALLAFLQQRGSNNRGRRTTFAEHPQPQPSPTTTTKSVTFAKEKKASSPGAMSDLDAALASVRTYEDLDEKYERYAGAKESAAAPPVPHSTIDTDGKTEFAIAVELLRSTSPHQTLWAARCVARELQSHLDADPTTKSPLLARTIESLPKLLPVSLRCLLDCSIVSSGTGGSALQVTYVLQSLYALLQLCAHPDHVVEVTRQGGRRRSNAAASAAAIYQLYALDDAVPQPRLRLCYEAMTTAPTTISTSKDDERGTSAYYTTPATSESSAQADAAAFWKDPMWTLLSRMRILPRLAALARPTQPPSHGGASLPREAWVAVCGILAMVGQRSPGAATAILEHESLLPSLEAQLLFAQKSGGGAYQPSTTIPIIVMYGILARQSRYAAQRVADRTSDKIVEILSLDGDVSDGNHDHAQWMPLHNWTLVLWRTLLRYGLASSIAPTILTLATPSMTLGLKSDSSLVTAAYYSSFAKLLDYASSTSYFVHSESKNAEEHSSSTQHEIRAQTALWLTAESSWRQAINHLHMAGEDDRSPASIAFFTSILMFLKASLHHVIETVGREVAAHTRTEIVGRMEGIAQAIQDLMSTSSAGDLIPAVARSVTAPQALGQDSEEMDMEREASSCALVTALSSLLIYLSKQTDLMGPSDSMGSLMGCWTRKIELNHICVGGNTVAMEMSRHRWLNLGLASILMTNVPQREETPGIAQSLAFWLVGRLQYGEEALFAAVLNRGFLNSDTRDTTRLLTALAMLIGGSSSGRSQLQHSRLVLNSFVSYDTLNIGSAPLDLRSLLAECGDASVEDFLPLGAHWLWQMAAGSFQSGKADAATAEKENQAVMADALATIIEFETSEESSLMMYANSLGLGPKVYWLIRLFLQTGGTNSVDDANKILCKCMAGWNDEESTSFATVCREQHAQQDRKPKEDTGDVDPAAKKIFESNIPDATIRALEALANDVCDKFMLEGYETAFGVLCARVFLTNGFPTKVRCLVLQRFMETIHLLSHNGFNGDDKTWLLSCVAPGIAIGSSRAAPEFIDQLVDLYATGSVIRPDDHFVKTLTILVLTRSVILNAINGNQPALSVMYRRLNLVDRRVASAVLALTSRYLETNDEGSESLIEAAFKLPIGFCDATPPNQTNITAELASVLATRYGTTQDS